MIRNIVSMIEQRGFHKIEVNVEQIQVYYQVLCDEVNVLMLLFVHNGDEFSEHQYQHITAQIHKSFESRGYDKIKMLTIAVSRHPEVAKHLCGEQNNVWIIDEQMKKLLLYENSSYDFLELRKPLEAMCQEMNVEEDSFSTKRDSDTNLKRTRNNYKISPINAGIIGLNIMIFIIMDLFSLTDTMLDKGALFWPMVVYNHEYYRIITCMFLHGGINHLVNNMMVLFFIGDKVEKIVGKIKYLIIYFGAGIIAGICSMRYNMEKVQIARSIGASGAIFGVVGAIAYIVIINRGRLRDISTRQILLFVALSLYSGFTSQGVDNIAHVGGLIAGGILAAIMYHRKTVT